MTTTSQAQSETEFPVAGSDAPTDDISPEFSRLQFTNYTTREMAKELYQDAGLEWPDWVEDPSSLPDTTDGRSGNDGIVDDSGSGDGSVDSNGDTGGSATGTDRDSQTDPSADVSKEQTTPPAGQQVPTHPGTVTIGGKAIPFQQAQALVEWGEYLRANPDKAEQVMSVMRGEVIPPAPTQRDRSDKTDKTDKTDNTRSVVPDGFTADDPKDKFVLDKITELNSTLTNLQHLTQQQIEAANKSKAEADVNIAISRLKSTHPTFTDDDIKSIRQKTAELQIVPAMIAKNQSDPVTGLVQAMEAGMWNVPGIRDRLYNQETDKSNKTNKTTGSSNGNTTHTSDRTRQSKLSALSGGSGSTPRVDPSPRLDSDREMKDAIAKAVSAYFPGNSNN